MHDDNQLLEELGGTGKVAARLGFSAQRVCNWRQRGIPAHIKLKFPDIFLTDESWRTKRRRKKKEAGDD